jgi:hypothetical protein
MGTSDLFERLTQALEQLESGAVEIQHVEATRRSDAEAEGCLRATVDAALPLCASDAGDAEDTPFPTAASIREDGGLRIDFPPAAVPTTEGIDDERVSVDGESVRVDDGTVLVTSTVRVASTDDAGILHVDSAVDNRNEDDAEADRRTDGSGEPPDNDVRTRDGASTDRSNPDAERENEDRPEAISKDESSGETGVGTETDTERDESVPPYDDEPYLRQLYEACDTFDEMPEAYERDVAAETVRRYMTEAGVHEPSSYGSVSDTEGADVDGDSVGDDPEPISPEENDADSSEDSTESRRSQATPDEAEEVDPVKGIANQEVLADGIGLPEGLSIEQLADAVENSMTLYEVKQALNLGWDETRRLLERLNLLDVVVTRLSEQDQRGVSRAEIADRIRQSVASD